MYTYLVYPRQADATRADTRLKPVTERLRACFHRKLPQSTRRETAVLHWAAVSMMRGCCPASRRPERYHKRDLRGEGELSGDPFPPSVADW
ncbi:hypothetical protein FKM82_025983 [Ascaphus truei]